jgi:hypothetical protein
MDLNTKSTKELKEQLNKALGSLAYDDSLSDFVKVAPFLGTLLARGYDTIAAHTYIGVHVEAIGQKQFDTPLFFTLQTPYSKAVNYKSVLDEFSQKQMSWGKALSDGEFETRFFAEGLGKKPNNNTSWVGVVDSVGRGVPLVEYLSTNDNSLFGIHSFDALYNLAAERSCILYILSDEEVSRLFEVPLEDAKNYLTFGIKCEGVLQRALKLEEDEFYRLVSEPPKKLFKYLINYSKKSGRINFSTDSENLLKYFSPFYNEERNDFFVKNNRPPITKENFLKSYSTMENVDTNIPALKNEKSSNTKWWVLGGLGVVGVFIFAKYRKNK